MTNTSTYFFNDKHIHVLQKLHLCRDIVCCHRIGKREGIRIYVREDFDVKLVLQKTTAVSEFITIKVIAHNSPPVFVANIYINGRNERTFQKELEECLIDPLLVGNAQIFVYGNLNPDFMKANSLSRNIENLFT